MYIHDRENWTDFRWSSREIEPILDRVSRAQGRLYGRLLSLGFDDRVGAMAENLSRDVITSSEIEGIKLNVEEVRSSIARKLGLENANYTTPSRYVDGIVSVMLDAIDNYDVPLSKEKLCAWQTAFFPTGFSDGSEIEVGKYRTHSEHIVSGFFGREKVHYVAPSPERIEFEMHQFLDWFNADTTVPDVMRSAIAHLWFVSIHPFEDGNGRLARIISDIMLARADKTKFRFYNISSEINRDKKHYYDILERTQKGDGDITEWIVWFLKTLESAIEEANIAIVSIINKGIFWQRAHDKELSQRQINLLNRFLDGYEAKLTSKTWSSLAKCSKDTAIRDIKDLLQKGLIKEDIPGAKRPSYTLCFCDIGDQSFDISIKQENDRYYLVGDISGNKVKERISKLDAERIERKDVPIQNIIEKYCSYLLI